LCSDGVWEFLTNEQVKEIGRGFYLKSNPNGYVEKLIKQSVKEWKDNDNTIDDITAIVLFF
jgi:serine/threonine protein phosphatase PrpC